MKEMDIASFGYRVRQQRRQLKMTQDQLAKRAGISVSFLGHIERGTRKAGIETLVALANALDVSTDTLLQESLNPTVVGVNNYRQRSMLQEINRLLQDNIDSWSE